MSVPETPDESTDALTQLRRRLVGLSGGLGDLNLLRILPEVGLQLRQIRDFVATVASEVTEMNRSVANIEPEVVQVAKRLDGIEARTAAIEASMQGMHERLETLDATLHPLRRRGRRPRPTGEE